MRLNVYLPDELAATIKAELPDVKPSRVLQAALAELLDCRHREASCADCGQPVDLVELVDVALSRFYRDLLDDLDVHINRGGTAEGSARIAKHVAERHQVSASRRPLPRPPRARREAIARARTEGDVTVFPDPYESIDHHPANPRRTA